MTSSAPIRLDDDAVAELADWYDLGWRALDTVAHDAAGARSDPAVARALRRQLHSSRSGPALTTAATSACHPVTTTTTSRTCTSHRGRPSDPATRAYWNASFGALLPRSAVTSVADAVRFLRDGLSRLVS